MRPVEGVALSIISARNDFLSGGWPESSIQWLTRWRTKMA